MDCHGNEAEKGLIPIYKTTTASCMQIFYLQLINCYKNFIRISCPAINRIC